MDKNKIINKLGIKIKYNNEIIKNKNKNVNGQLNKRVIDQKLIN